MKTLLKNSEVDKILKKDLPNCDWGIQDIEEAEIVACFSREFYECLIADLKEDWLNAIDWCDGDYVEGSVVVYEGQVWIADSDTSERPDCKNWSLYCRFNTKCFCELWNKYLGRYLAWVVYRANLADLLLTGVIRKKNKEADEFYSKEERNLLACNVEEKINMIWQNLQRFVMRQIQACNPCYDKIAKCWKCWNACPCDCTEPDVERKKLGVLPVLIARPQNTDECCLKNGYSKRN